MTGPERIEGRPEGGWIVTGPCGVPHLVTGVWEGVQCRTCLAIIRRERAAVRDRLRAEEEARLALYYPEQEGQR